MTTSEPSRKAAARAARAWLRATWPKSIGANVPLVIGVREAVLAAAGSPHGERAISDGLRSNAASPKYIAALVSPGAWRHDLDGSPVEPVSPEHQAHAAEPVSNGG